MASLATSPKHNLYRNSRVKLNSDDNSLNENSKKHNPFYENKKKKWSSINLKKRKNQSHLNDDHVEIRDFNVKKFEKNLISSISQPKMAFNPLDKFDVSLNDVEDFKV